MKQITLRLLTGTAALASCMLLLPLTASAQAQTDPNAAPQMMNSSSANTSMMMMHHHGDEMRSMRDLDLTESQRDQLKAIHDKFKADHPDMSAVTPAEHKALMEQIMAVLTPDQRVKFREHLKEMKEMHEMHKMHRMHHPHPNEMPTVAP